MKINLLYLFWNFYYCDIAGVKTFFPSPVINFSSSDVRARDGGQRASIPWDIPCSVLALPPVPCRCHPCYRQDVAPGGLFMFCGQTLMDDYSSTPRVIRTADRLLRAIWLPVPFRRHASMIATSYVFTYPPLFCAKVVPRRAQGGSSSSAFFLLLSLLFAPCLFVYAACSRVRMHQSDKVSPCVRMKDRARQTEGKGKWQMRGRELCYSCAPVCSHFVLFLSLCKCGVVALQERAHQEQFSNGWEQIKS